MISLRLLLSRNAFNCRWFASSLEGTTRKSPNPKNAYEPQIDVKPTLPTAGVISIRMQNYDWEMLEHYQSYVHKLAKNFRFIVSHSYAVAAQSDKIQTFKKNSSTVVSEFKLTTYDRWIRMEHVTAYRLPLFVLLIQAHAPIGTVITVKEHEKADEIYRYIPDLLLKAKRDELKSLDDKNVRKQLGWE